MKKFGVVVFSSLILGAVTVFGSQVVEADEIIWTPRTVEQVKQDIGEKSTYEVKWGDTLSVISEATNISIQKLQSMNNIANVDLIFVGNTFTFDGTAIVVTNNNKEVIAESTVTPNEKNNANAGIWYPEENEHASNNESSVTGSENQTSNTPTENQGETPTVENQGNEDTSKNVQEDNSTIDNGESNQVKPDENIEEDNKDEGNSGGDTGGNGNEGEQTGNVEIAAPSWTYDYPNLVFGKYYANEDNGALGQFTDTSYIATADALLEDTSFNPVIETEESVTTKYKGWDSYTNSKGLWVVNFY